MRHVPISGSTSTERIQSQEGPRVRIRLPPAGSQVRTRPHGFGNLPPVGERRVGNRATACPQQRARADLASSHLPPGLRPQRYPKIPGPTPNFPRRRSGPNRAAKNGWTRNREREAERRPVPLRSSNDAHQHGSRRSACSTSMVPSPRRLPIPSRRWREEDSNLGPPPRVGLGSEFRGCRRKAPRFAILVCLTRRRRKRASAPLAKGHDLRTVPWRFFPQHLV